MGKVSAILTIFCLIHSINRRKNTFSGAGSFLVIGYGLAFGSGSQFIGYTYFGLIGLEFKDFGFLFFQVKQYSKHNKKTRI